MAGAGTLSTQQVSEAVSALNGPSAEHRDAANKWLLQFLESDAAWEAGVALLDPGHGGQLQFFGANMVLVKVRNAWTKLTAHDQAQLTTAVSSKFQALLSTPQTELVVVQRMCLALGAIAASGGPSAAGPFAAQAVQLARDACGSGDLTALRAGIDLLTAVAEEAETHLGGKPRQAVCAALAEQGDEVLATLGVALPQALNTAGGERAACAAVKCFQAWLGLDASGGGTALVSPGELYTSHRQLFDGLLGALGSDSSQLLEDLAEVLGMFFGSGKFGRDEAAEEAALRAAVQGLLRQHPRMAGAEDGEALARALATAATAVAERSPEACAGGLEEAVQLANMMLEALERPEQSVADAALEFVSCLDYVAMTERAPQLQGPMYARLLPLLLRHAAFPADFTSWDDCLSIDEEVFLRFREQILADGFETAYNVLRAQYLMYCGKAFAEAQSWQAAEAALLAVRVAAEDAVPRALEDGRLPPNLQADRAATNQYLQQLFGTLVAAEDDGGHRFRGSAFVAAATAKLIGACGQWFGQTPGAPLEGALNLLLQTLPLPEASHPAALAFRTMCARCGPQLQTSATLLSLAPAVDAAMSAAAAARNPLALEDRRAVAEGLAKLASGLPTGEAAAAGVAIITPTLQRLQQLMAAPGGGEPTAGAAAAVADEVLVLATVCRHLEFAAKGAAAGEPHPAMQILQSAYPTLDALLQLQGWRSHAAVVSAVCTTYRHAMQSIKHGVERLLPTLVTSLDLVFQATRSPAALATLAGAAQLCAESEQARPALAGAFSAASSLLAPVFQNGKVPEEQEAVAAFFNLADGLLRSAPGTLLPSEQLPAVVAWAAACLRVREAQPVSAAVELLAHLVSPAGAGIEADPGFQANRQQLQQAVGQRGPALVQSALCALCDTCPRNLMRPQAMLLHGLLTGAAWQEPAHAWLAAALQSAELQGVMEPSVTRDDCSRFYGMATRVPGLPSMRFVGLVTDFANIARGEATGDVLLAYEL